MVYGRPMGKDSVEYHRETVIDRADDHPGAALAYYGSRGETPLVWRGQAARALGLEGTVTHETYGAMYGPGGARHPVTGVKLANTERPGFELVVRPPKTVSILGVIGREDDMHAILDAEKRATMEYLEGVVRGKGGRRGAGGRVRVATEGLVWAETRHATSRAGDPDLHDHILVANVTQLATGESRAVDTDLIKEHTSAATWYGRLAGAWEARQRGYAVERVYDQRQMEKPVEERGEPTMWRIGGMSTEIETLFSKRSGEIDEEIRKKGVADSFHNRGIAARSTRAKKRHESVEGELMPRWHAEMAALGLSRLIEESGIVGARMTYREPELASRDERVSAMLAPARGDVPAGRLAESKVWFPRTVVVAAGPALIGLDPSELDRTVAAVKADREAVPLAMRVPPRGAEFGFSTATTLAIEGAIAKATDRAMEEMAEPGPGVEEAAIDVRFTPGQRAALIGVTSSEHRMDLIVGVAGAGKTTVLSAVREAYEADGWQVIGTATSGQAARNLGIEAGMPAGTIRSMLWKVDHGRLRLDERTVLVLDEAGMVDDRDWLQLLRHAERAGCRLVAVGDHRQLGAVGPGGSFEALQARHPDAVHVLSDNVRQKDLEEREALEQLRAGRVAAAVSWYAGRGRLQVAPTGAEVMDLAVAAWWADTVAGKVTALLAYTRRNVAELNRLARERMVEAGRIDVTREVAGFSPGDRIVVTKGDGHAHVVTSERGTVADVGALNGLPGLVVTLDSGAVRTVTDLDGLALGYAVTTHRAQGMTCDVSHYLAEGARELSYVALSRGREANYAYTVADSIDQAVEDLGVMWRREERDIWVHDSDRVLHGADNIEAARLFEWPKIKPVEIREPEVEQEWEISL